MALRRQAISERAQRTAERAQRHVELAAERSHELAEKDAAERRITELYVAAVQQLGSDKAPVRLGGLYAMERIGNDYPKMRQTIMDVWCAYLRMPYAPPAEVLPDDGLSLPHPVAQNHVASDPEQASRRQELQVRLTAQRLIRTHLHAPSDMKTEPAAYWRGPDGERMNLDVSGATLVEFDLSACQLDTLIATNAQFHGHADMTRAQFHGAVTLSGAQFHGWAYLTHAHFYGDTSLDWARFHTESYLTGAHFRRDTYLTGVQFMAFTTLAAAQFYGKVDLMDGQFHGQADLAATRFRGHVNLSDAQFREGLAMTTTQFDRMPVVHRMAVARPADLPVGWMADTDQGPEGRFEVLFATATTATATAAPATDSAAMAMGADVHQPTEDATEPITAPW